jgi:hypothetical protein
MLSADALLSGSKQNGDTGRSIEGILINYIQRLRRRRRREPERAFHPRTQEGKDGRRRGDPDAVNTSDPGDVYGLFDEGRLNISSGDLQGMITEITHER